MRSAATNATTKPQSVSAPVSCCKLQDFSQQICSEAPRLPCLLTLLSSMSALPRELWEGESMARPQKRQQSDNLSRDHSLLKHQYPSYPPEFWDNLSKQWLTRRALRELNRRNSTTQPSHPKATAGGHCANIPKLVKESGRGLARFARQGGPNLFDLRGVSLR